MITNSISDLIKRSKVTEAPSEQPVTLSQLKDHLNLGSTFDSDDTLLTLQIEAATSWAEQFTGRKFIDQELTMFLDDWPFSIFSETWWAGTRQGARQTIRQSEDYISIPWPPLASITSVSTFSDDNTETVYSSSNYITDNSDFDIMGRLIFNLSSTFPSDLRSRNAIKIVFRAGYGAAADVPADVKQGILMIAAYLYTNRGDCNDCSCVSASGARSYLSNKVVYSII